MLQCSNYKGPAEKESIQSRLRAGNSRNFYQKPNVRGAYRPRLHYSPMTGSAAARNLQSLLWVASKLRQLANDTLCQGDKTLYLMAAEALEKRAQWLAAALPQESQDGEAAPQPHPPVNLII